MTRTSTEGRALLLVEKQTYKPSGWRALREVEVKVRLTAKRATVIDGGRKGLVFDRATGEEIQSQAARIGQSIRYTIIGWLK